MSAEAFKTSRDRDAWGTIRGFVFQVTQTVLRWIDLGPQDALELERGEDIDVCCNALSRSDEEQQTRVLEQLKNRDGRISLRSPEVAEFLANARDHHAANPDLHLRFRFVTTASPAIERPTPLTPRVSAITKWTDLIASGGAVDASALAAIRQLLLSVNQPSKCPTEVWERYQVFLKNADDADVLTFMCQVEWALGQGDIDELRQRACEMLVTKKLTDASSAKGLYDRLFVEVFDRLSRPGLKRLTAADLTQSLAAPLDVGAQLRLQALVATLEVHQERLTRAEAELATHGDQIRRLVEAQAPRFQPSFARETQTYRSPPLLPKIAHRVAIKTQVVERLTSHQIVVLIGEPGYGKTQLALLVAQGQPHAWVRLSGRPADEVAQFIQGGVDHALAQKWPLVVLDNLPVFVPGDLIGDALLGLGDTPVRILVTSTRELPARLTLDLRQSCDHFSLPAFEEQDIRELLGSSGAPTAVTAPAMVNLFASVTAGHPTLVQALVAYLTQNGWQLDEKVLRDIFKRRFSEKVREDMMHLLASTVPDLAARELLYRLDLVGGPARRVHVDALASVPTAITLPLEKVAAVRGVWIRQDAEDRVLLSPLLEGSGKARLPLPEVKAVHLALSEVALGAKPMSVSDLRSGLRHLLSAGQIDKAGAVYAKAALHFREDATPTTRFPMLVPGWPKELPDEMSIGTRALIHGAHLRIADRLGGDAVPHLEAILKLAALADVARLSASDVSGLFAAAGMAGPLRARTSLTDAIALASVSLRCLDRFVVVAPEAVTPELRVAVIAGLWLAGAAIKTPSDMLVWLDEVGRTTPETASVAIEALKVAPSIMSYTPRMLLFRVSQTTQDWAALDGALDAWTTAGERLRQPLFVAGALSARIIMRNEFMKDPEAALRIGAAAVSRAWASPDADFVVRVAYGNALADTALTDTTQAASAIAALEQAVDLPATIDPVDRGRALIRLSAMTQSEPDRSIKFARRAVALCDQAPELPWTERVKANAELGMAIARKDGAKAAFDAFASAANDFLVHPIEHSDQKGLFVWMGHTTGYYTSMAVSGRPPEGVADGGEYAEPPRGLFLNDPAKPAPLFNPHRRALMAVHMEEFARAVGRTDDATAWGRRATDMVESSGDTETQALLARNSLPFLLLDNAFDFALQGAVGAAKIARRDKGAPHNPVNAEMFGRWLAFLPAFTRVFDLALRGDVAAPVAARELLNACNERLHISNDTAWGVAAELVRIAAENRSNLLTPELEERVKAGNESPLVLALTMAKGRLPDRGIGQLAADHLVVIQQVCTAMRTSEATLRLVYMPFLSTFWRKILATSRFQFTPPDLMDSSLAELENSRGDEEALRTFMTRLASLVGLRRLPKALQAWLAK